MTIEKEGIQGKEYVRGETVWVLWDRDLGHNVQGAEGGIGTRVEILALVDETESVQTVEIAQEQSPLADFNRRGT